MNFGNIRSACHIAKETGDDKALALAMEQGCDDMPAREVVSYIMDVVGYLPTTRFLRDNQGVSSTRNTLSPYASSELVIRLDRDPELRFDCGTMTHSIQADASRTTYDIVTDINAIVNDSAIARNQNTIIINNRKMLNFFMLSGGYVDYSARPIVLGYSELGSEIVATTAIEYDVHDLYYTAFWSAILEPRIKDSGLLDNPLVERVYKECKEEMKNPIYSVQFEEYMIARSLIDSLKDAVGWCDYSEGGKITKDQRKIMWSLVYFGKEHSMRMLLDDGNMHERKKQTDSMHVQMVSWVLRNKGEQTILV